MASTMETGVLMHGEPMHEEFELENGCGCFRSLWSTGTRRVTSDDDQWNLLSERRGAKDLWVVTQFKKLRGASELVAGPKWKNLIRKIGAYFNNNKKRRDFQYDSYNYTLNFDNGTYEDDEDGGGLGFSSRFAPPVNDNQRSSTS